MVPHKCHFNVIGYCVKWCRIFQKSSTYPQNYTEIFQWAGLIPKLSPIVSKKYDTSRQMLKAWRRFFTIGKNKVTPFCCPNSMACKFHAFEFSNNRSINYGKKESFINLNRSCFLICNGQKLWAGSLTLFGSLVGTLVN